MTTENIWNEFGDRLLGYIQKRVDDRQLAEDIRQDVFIKLHLNAKTTQKPKNIAAWLYRTTHNAIVDHYRKNSSNEVNISNGTAIPDRSPGPFDADFTPCVRPFLRQLSDQDREALELTLLGNLSQKAYADQIGQPYSTVKSRISRALNKLHLAFVNCCDVISDSYGNLQPQKTCKHLHC